MGEMRSWPYTLLERKPHFLVSLLGPRGEALTLGPFTTWREADREARAYILAH